MNTLPLRLPPGADLRAALEATVAAQGCRAAFVIAGIGSLGRVMLLRAGATGTDRLEGDYEILTLSGTVAANGSHLHLAIADTRGRVIGGHAGQGCIARTTAEVLLALLPDWSFAREHDAATGHDELTLRRIAPDAG
ncbi:MAG: DNA-binding protein [Burkholderiales bacterium]|nr:DNA-binding protein [Burkholderiales bacterium]